MELSTQGKYNVIFCVALLIILFFMVNIINRQNTIEKEINEFKNIRRESQIIIKKQESCDKLPRIEFLDNNNNNFLNIVEN